MMPEMDPYTEKVLTWLDRRFRQVDDDGIYFAHQPIYGFRQGHAEGWPTARYVITTQIVRALSHLRFGSFLDIGGAEGYKAALVRDLFGVTAMSCDLSEEACRRARAIYDMPGRPVDIHALPFQDGEFDVVLCSETLEHVARLEEATRELLRVARRALIVTVPREPVEVVERNIREQIPHAHIHALRPDSFDFARPLVNRILVRKMLCGPLTRFLSLADAMPRTPGPGLKGLALRGYNALLPLTRLVVGKGMVGGLIDLDDRFANGGLPYGGMLFVLLKDESAWSEAPLRPMGPRQVIDFAVPLHVPDDPLVADEATAGTL